MKQPQRAFGKMLRKGWKMSKLRRLGKPGKAQENQANRK